MSYPKHTYRTVTKTEKTFVITRLETIIKRMGAAKTKAIITHYFKNMKEREQTKKQISELEKELENLKKKI